MLTKSHHGCKNARLIRTCVLLLHSQRRTAKSSRDRKAKRRTAKPSEGNKAKTAKQSDAKQTIKVAVGTRLGISPKLQRSQTQSTPAEPNPHSVPWELRALSGLRQRP